MARTEWRGDSQAVAQVRRFTVAGAPAAGDTISLVCNLKEVTYTLVTGDTALLAASALATLWNAAAFPESKDAASSYTDPNAYLELTATTAGRPFTITAAATGTTTLTASDITASKGPNHADDVDNWTSGFPDAADNPVLIAGGESLLYGLGTIDGTVFDIRASFENAIGLPRWNAAGYYEYRPRELTLNGATVYIGRGAGNGASALYIKTIAGATVEVHKTGIRQTDSLPTLDLGATGNPTAVKISGASDVGILCEDETTARTFSSLSLAGDESRVTIGRTATVTNFDKDSGAADVYGTVTNPTIGRGTYNQHEGGFTTMVAYGGTIRLMHTGTATSVTGKGSGDGTLEPVFDCEGNNAARTFTDSSFTGGAHLLDVNKTVTFTNAAIADQTFFANSRLGPSVTFNRT